MYSRGNDPHAKGGGDTPRTVYGDCHPASKLSHIRAMAIVVPVANLTRTEYAQHAQVGTKTGFDSPKEVIQASCIFDMHLPLTVSSGCRYCLVSLVRSLFPTKSVGCIHRLASIAKIYRGKIPCCKPPR